MLQSDKRRRFAGAGGGDYLILARRFPSTGPGYARIRTTMANSITRMSDSKKTILKVIIYFLRINMRLISQQIITVVSPNISTPGWKLSSEISGDKTATPKITWPALSKIFDNLANWLILSIGFLFRSQLFISVYDSLGFIGMSSGDESPVTAVIKE